MRTSLDPVLVESVRLNMRLYRKMRKRGLSDYQEIREGVYVVAARLAERFIREELRSGKEYIPYGDIRELLGTDRFTVSWVLGKLQELNTAESSPLWSSFVGYKGIGGPGGSFFTCAKDLGWKWECSEDGFLSMMRGLCRRALGVSSDATV